jgi:hypothetical protein
VSSSEPLQRDPGPQCLPVVLSHYANASANANATRRSPIDDVAMMSNSKRYAAFFTQAPAIMSAVNSDDLRDWPVHRTRQDTRVDARARSQ